MSMAWRILITLLMCPLAAWLGRRGGRWAQLLVLWPLYMAVWAILGLGSALSGAVVQDSVDWVPGLGLSLSFRLDGLSGLFVLLICGVGAYVVLYAAHYFDGHVLLPDASMAPRHRGVLRTLRVM
jgi:multicomponent Na+:H+ antiporter subunit A